MNSSTRLDDASCVTKRIPSPGLPRLILYGSGEAATSLVLNGLYGFALIFYTEALGLSPALAGIALSISIFWEAITEPYMGYVSDRTRNRFGTRFPWIAAGGAALAVTFYFIWAVPQAFRGGGVSTFAYLVLLNILLRTSLTMFVVPYLALGFEIAPEYDDRPRLQGVRWVCNMAANMAGPALAWIVFFKDRQGPDGRVIPGTSIVQNFTTMGLAFSIAIVLLTALMLWGCRSAARDTRLGAASAPLAHAVGFWAGFKPILKDRDVFRVLILIFLMVVGMVIVSSMQSYLYVHFMVFSGGQKTIVHGSTMVAAAIGAVISPWAARRFDKKGAVIFGALIGIVGQVGLATLFLPGWMPRAGVAAILPYIFFQGLYWVASGIVLPVATAMIADVAELGRLRTSRSVEGSYSAIFSLAWRMGTSLALLLTGVLLDFAGFHANSGSTPSPDVMWRIMVLYTLIGALFYVFAIVWVRGYTLDRARYRAATSGESSPDEAP